MIHCYLKELPGKKDEKKVNKENKAKWQNKEVKK